MACRAGGKGALLLNACWRLIDRIKLCTKGAVAARGATLLRQGRHDDRRRGQRGRRVERVVVVVTAGATLNGRVHVVAEERPGALYINSEREERTQNNNDAEMSVALA